MKKLAIIFGISAGALLLIHAQDRTTIKITGGTKPKLAVPDFRGSGDAQRLMAVFNQTLWTDLQNSGLFDLTPKTSMPLFIPQQPSDFQQPREPAPGRRGRQPQPQNGGGHWMKDWSDPPLGATHLAFGYTAAQNGVLVLLGWVYDLAQSNPANARLIGNRYAATVDEAGARKIAHEFAADIIAAGGGQSLFGTHIYFTSTRTGHKEIWRMDFDGKNQRQITHFNNLTDFASVSPDGTKIACTSWVNGPPAIFVFSVEPVRKYSFFNQTASVNATPSFTKDGKQILYSSSVGPGCCRIFIANLDGTGFKPISPYSSIDVEPKVNPRTGNDIVFTSGRSGPHQVYRMNMDGADIERLTPGNGEAGNPSWHPNGQMIAFSWTQGYATGGYNIFWMDVANPTQYKQLTHGEGKNENPSWSPDGTHIVFGSTRRGRSQIYSMLADGSNVQQLTDAGENMRPVWGK